MLHTRTEIISRAVREFEQLDAIIGCLATSAWDVTVSRRDGEDAWTVKDALAHITARKQDFVAEFGGPPRRRDGLGVHAYNHVTFEEWHNRPVAELIEWHGRVQRDLLEALSAAPESWFMREAPRPWPAAVDGHSARHRKFDIERALHAQAKLRVVG